MANGQNGKMYPSYSSANSASSGCYVEGSANGIQTFFMPREELAAHDERQQKKFGRYNFKLGKVEKFIKGKWVVVDDKNSKDVD